MPSVIYFAHPVGPPCACWDRREALNGVMHSTHAEIVACNIARAKRWLRWCWEVAPDVAIIAPWLPMVELLDDANPSQRERGLRDNCATAALCYGIIGAGGRWSPGMMREENELLVASDGLRCHRVIDLTPLGPEPPGTLSTAVPALDDIIHRLRALC